MLRRQRLKQEITLELSALYDLEHRQHIPNFKIKNENDLRLQRFYDFVST